MLKFTVREREREHRSRERPKEKTETDPFEIIQSFCLQSMEEIQMKHWSHKHPMILKKAKEIQTLASGGSYCKCDGCSEQVSGPFYSCKKEGCCYNLHKVCAELPFERNHPLHPQHTLTLTTYCEVEYYIRCHMCRKKSNHKLCQFFYICLICWDFALDVICASGSHTVKDKCHMHPLIPMQLPSCFLCTICGKEEKGVSYKCGSCPFWTHQDCTVLLPDFVKCGDHDHQLTLSPSIPNELVRNLEGDFKCNVCYADVTGYETVYSCVECSFFSHARCATADGEDDEEDHDDVNTKHLPVMSKYWTTLISSIGGTPKHAGDLISKQISDHDELIDNEIDHFSHDHVLHLHDDGQWNDDDNVCGKVCEACAEPILGPSYGCIRCDYFLHKCCIRLPKQISHPYHPEHDIELFPQSPDEAAIFRCSSCEQLCNTFGYKCVECDDFQIDVKCASLSGRIKHEAHKKHTLSSDIFGGIRCAGCGYDERGRKCETCSFNLCLRCTTLPPIVNHRYCKCKGLRLQYSPLKNYISEYYCDICEAKFIPQHWFYHCGACDTFAHRYCLNINAIDSNIKFGKRYNLPEHEHELIITRFTYEYSNCKLCVSSLNKGIAVGFKCETCPYFKIHLDCKPFG